MQCSIPVKGQDDITEKRKEEKEGHSLTETMTSVGADLIDDLKFDVTVAIGYCDTFTKFFTRLKHKNSSKFRHRVNC